MMNKKAKFFAGDDTVIGGAGDRFPATQWSAIAVLGSATGEERTRAFSIVIETYWKPVYKYVRLKWAKTNEDAKDLTQGFFAVAMEKDFFKNYDPAKARFRTFLRTCLDGFVANENKAAGRLKRGGGATMLSLDFDGAESELRNAPLPAEGTPDDYFDREWIRSLFGLAVHELEAHCTSKGKNIHFQLFTQYDLNDNVGKRPTYETLAGEFGISVTDATNYLAYARREFRAIVLQKLRELTVSDEEFRDEARRLLGVNPA
jgi:DNA-directed RNA polymerase specialized sigma24 family protein